MTATAVTPAEEGPSLARAARAWVLYDWANSAFTTTVIAAVLPVYFSTVAGATLPSPARATQVFSIATSASLVVLGLLSPVLGSYADLAAAKKRLLGTFMGIGAVATAALVLVGEGDWLLAAVLFGIGRIGFGFGNVVYDALLPAVAAPEDRDRVSSRGFAAGYLGGGLLLTANVAMIFALPDDNLGVRLSFLSVAVWWALFSVPILRRVPEPAPSGAPGTSVGLAASFRQVRMMLRDLRGFRDLRRYLVAFLVYNDAINVIIGAAAIYGAELGFEGTDLILAILLVQFLAGPYALLWGRASSDTGRRRARVLAFLVANIVLVPLFGIVGRLVLPADVTGLAPPAPPTVLTIVGPPLQLAVGEGEALVVLTGTPVDDEFRNLVEHEPGAPVDGRALGAGGQLVFDDVPTDELERLPVDEPTMAVVDEQYRDAEIRLAPVDAIVRPSVMMAVGINSEGLPDGRDVVVLHDAGPEQGLLDVMVGDSPALDEDGEPVVLDASAPVERTGVAFTVRLAEPGRHLLTIAPTGEPGADTEAGLDVLAPTRITSVEVEPPQRESVLPFILGGLVAVQLVAGAFAWVLGPAVLGDLAATLDSRRTIVVTLLAYLVIAVWGFALDTVIEFWSLAWMVALVQGGSQAISRSLFTTLIPERRAGEFFGLFSILSKAASFVSPLFFVVAVALFGTSRPALLAVAAMFVAGIWLLRGVDVERGRAAVAGTAPAVGPADGHAGR